MILILSTQFANIALATGADYVRLETNAEINQSINLAFDLAKQGKPVLLDVNIDYSKKTRFTEGIVGTNLQRLPFQTKVRMISRALVRKMTG